MDKAGVGVIASMSGVIVGIIVGIIIVVSTFEDNHLDNMIVKSVSKYGKEYKLLVNGLQRHIYTKHLYTVGDTIKLCK